MVSNANAETYCSELFDDCREKIEVVENTFTITGRYGDTFTGYSVTLGTGIPYYGLRSVEDPKTSLGTYRIIDDILIHNMVIYHRVDADPPVPKKPPESVEAEEWPANRKPPPLPKMFP
jgi:hypothetical protein